LFLAVFLFLQGKIFICVASAIVAFLWMDSSAEYKEGGSKELSGVALPLLMTLLLSYAVASAFLGVYNLAIDTILLCFCEDKKVRKVLRLECS
jgi:solute carrier family 44 (choline transporter-like protein), member 2/4/5